MNILSLKYYSKRIMNKKTTCDKILFYHWYYISLIGLTCFFFIIILLEPLIVGESTIIPTRAFKTVKTW